ncbi:MAG: amino acid permease [Cyanobacteria bacterium SZAS-4]|nr:amino acid permease [Cyanobacteria bacterium SZAS-4]
MKDSQRRVEVVRREQDSWYKVMCLTGVDYFSSLGYAPGLAFIAAGVLSPIATIFLVLLTLLGALPVYSKVAAKSPHGQGSIYMLENLIPGWLGKVFVLCLLGFAATDFIITITLSAADATTHIIQNPWVPVYMQHRMILTFFMLALLGGFYLKGFRSAIGVSVVLVSIYLTLNALVVGVAFIEISRQPWLLQNWQNLLWHDNRVNGSIFKLLGYSCLFFPKLALGMSGFETGVAVMPHIKGDADDDPNHPRGRIRYSRWLLRTAAAIMSLFLISTSFATTVLIPQVLFQPGEAANGRALAYLAHIYLGHQIGTVYDISTVLILWFAGASAMAGLLSLVPQYLPRYGMAPEWARATRPLVVFCTLVAFAVTWLFEADVDAQAGAYATGVLVIMTSAAIACTLSVWRKKKVQRIVFSFITFIFVYTTVVNTFERPDGLRIASFFIAAMLITSLVSRVRRSTELRVKTVVLDPVAEEFISEASKKAVRLLAHRPGGPSDYATKAAECVKLHNIPQDQIIFLEISVSDASDFDDEILSVSGAMEGSYKVLRCESPAVPNAMAALLLYIRDKTHKQPHVYLGWTEGNPIMYILKYLFVGEGETAPLTREILREVEHDPTKRPRVHVG